MEDIRILPHVCGQCKDLILPPFENLLEFSDYQCTGLVEVCRKCKNKSCFRTTKQ